MRSHQIQLPYSSLEGRGGRATSYRQRYSQFAARYFLMGITGRFFLRIPERRRKSPIPFPFPPAGAARHPSRLGGEALVVGHKLSSHCKFHSNTRTWYMHGEISTAIFRCGPFERRATFHDRRSGVQKRRRERRGVSRGW